MIDKEVFAVRLPSWRGSGSIVRYYRVGNAGRVYWFHMFLKACKELIKIILTSEKKGEYAHWHRHFETLKEQYCVEYGVR